VDLSRQSRAARRWTCHAGVAQREGGLVTPESRSAKVDRHTLLRNEDFPINIKYLFDDDFLAEFF
jgi:hypothetical protein